MTCQWRADQDGEEITVMIIIAQLVEHCTSIAEVTGLNPVQA